MEISSYFGFFEAYRCKKNPWNVMAKTKTVIFAIHIDYFTKIFKEMDFYRNFVKAEKARYKEMRHIDEICGESIHKLISMQLKIEGMKIESLDYIKNKIMKAKQISANDGENKWNSFLDVFKKKSVGP